MTYGERAQMRTDALTARSPRWCPSCGARAIAPLFWPDASLDCWDCLDCFAVFSGRGD
jgi:ribosomal protein L37AE/L43A